MCAPMAKLHTGKHPTLGIGWQNFSRRIRTERGQKCEHCGATLAELQARFPSCTNWLQVAHKKSARAYPELRWDKSNLEVLCQACHEIADPFHERMLRAGRLARPATTLSPVI